MKVATIALLAVSARAASAADPGIARLLEEIRARPGLVALAGAVVRAGRIVAILAALGVLGGFATGNISLGIGR